MGLSGPLISACFFRTHVHFCWFKSHVPRNPHFGEMPTEPTIDPVPMPRAVRQVARHLRVAIFAEAAKNNLGWYNLACFRGYYPPKFFGGDCDCSSFLMFGDVLGCVQVF